MAQNGNRTSGSSREGSVVSPSEKEILYIHCLSLLLNSTPVMVPSYHLSPSYRTWHFWKISDKLGWEVRCFFCTGWKSSFCSCFPFVFLDIFVSVKLQLLSGGPWTACLSCRYFFALRSFLFCTACLSRASCSGRLRRPQNVSSLHGIMQRYCQDTRTSANSLRKLTCCHV